MSVAQESVSKFLYSTTDIVCLTGSSEPRERMRRFIKKNWGPRGLQSDRLHFDTIRRSRTISDSLSWLKMVTQSVKNDGEMSRSFM